jgi:hypothetical protein
MQRADERRGGGLEVVVGGQVEADREGRGLQGS